MPEEHIQLEREREQWEMEIKQRHKEKKRLEDSSILNRDTQKTEAEVIAGKELFKTVPSL